MKNKLRFIYGIIAFIIFLAEVYIALFVRDSFIRPYFGDVLVTALICCFIRALFPLTENYTVKRRAVYLMPTCVFFFAVFIEVCQFYNYVDLLGLGHIQFFRIIMGTGFAFEDIICYAVGCAVFFIFEILFRQKRN